MKDVAGMHIRSVMETVASAITTAAKIEIALDLSKHPTTTFLCSWKVLYSRLPINNKLREEKAI